MDVYFKNLNSQQGRYEPEQGLLSSYGYFVLPFFSLFHHLEGMSLTAAGCYMDLVFSHIHSGAVGWV